MESVRFRLDVDIDAWNLELELIVLNVRSLGALGIGIGNSTEYRAGIRLTDCTPPQYRAIGLRIGRNRSRSLPTSIPLSVSHPSPPACSFSGRSSSLRSPAAMAPSAYLRRAATPHPSIAPPLRIPPSAVALSVRRRCSPSPTLAALPSVPCQLPRRSPPSPANSVGAPIRPQLRRCSPPPPPSSSPVAHRRAGAGGDEAPLRPQLRRHCGCRYGGRRWFGG